MPNGMYGGVRGEKKNSPTRFRDGTAEISVVKYDLEAEGLTF